MRAILMYMWLLFKFWIMDIYRAWFLALVVISVWPIFSTISSSASYIVGTSVGLSKITSRYSTSFCFYEIFFSIMSFSSSFEKVGIFSKAYLLCIHRFWIRLSSLLFIDPLLFYWLKDITIYWPAITQSQSPWKDVLIANHTLPSSHLSSISRPYRTHSRKHTLHLQHVISYQFTQPCQENR